MEKKAKKNKFSFKEFAASKKNLTMVALIVALAVVFALFGIKIANQNSDIKRLEIQKQEVADKLEEQEKINEELEAVLNSDNKDDYIEQKAREEGYVKSDETVFYDISATE